MQRNDLVRYLVSFAFFMHGLGMVGGVYFVFTSKGWLLNALGGGLFTRGAIALVWIVSGLAFVASAWGVLTGQAWWQTTAWVAAPTTIIGVLLWAGGAPPGVYAGGVLALATLVYLIFAR